MKERRGRVPQKMAPYGGDANESILPFHHSFANDLSVHRDADRPAWPVHRRGGPVAQKPVRGSQAQDAQPGRGGPWRGRRLPCPAKGRHAVGGGSSGPGDQGAALRQGRVLLDQRPRQAGTEDGDACHRSGAGRQGARRGPVQQGDADAARHRRRGHPAGQPKPVRQFQPGGRAGRAWLRRVSLAQATGWRRRDPGTVSQAFLCQEARRLGLGDRFRNLHRRCRQRVSRQGPFLRRHRTGRAGGHRLAAVGDRSRHSAPARRRTDACDGARQPGRRRRPHGPTGFAAG